MAKEITLETLTTQIQKGFGAVGFRVPYRTGRGQHAGFFCALLFCEWKGLRVIHICVTVSGNLLITSAFFMQPERKPAQALGPGRCGLFVWCAFRTACVSVTKSSLVDCIDGLVTKSVERIYVELIAR
jgi:hypothetical protein